MTGDGSHADFVLTAVPGRDGGHKTLLGRGTLDAVGGELLDCAVGLLAIAVPKVVVDLSDCEIEDPGWLWLLSTIRACRASGVRLDLQGIAAGDDPTVVAEPPARPALAPQLRCYADGPLIARGDFEVIGRDGQPLPRNRKVVALCRCGASAIKPWCDGSHKVTGFRDDS